MLKKKFMLVAIFIVSLLAISAVSANEINATDEVIAEEIAIDDTNQIKLVSDEANEVLGMEPIPELQSLIDNSKNGDVIKLTRDYNVDFGYIAVNKSVTFDGNNHKINANNKDVVLKVSSDSVTLKNIQFVNWGNHNVGDTVGFLAVFASDVTISNCKFINCTSDDQSIVSSYEPNFSLDSCQFIDCNSLNDGIVYSEGSNLKVTNTEFTNNNYFYGNREHKSSSYDSNPLDSISEAGALYIVGDNALVENCNFKNNTGYMAGAIIVNGDKCRVKDSSFSNNRARHIKYYDSVTTYVGGKTVEIMYTGTAGAIRWNGNDGILENPVSMVNNKGYTDVNVFGTNYNEIHSTILKASDVTKYYGGSEKYTVTLTNNNVPIANGDVKINVGGKTSTLATNSKGQITMDLNLPVGTHNVVAEYGSASITSKVIVKSTVTANDATGTYSNSKVTATFLNVDGKALANTKVAFKINDKEYPATTNSNGVATASIPLGVDTYTVTAVNPANNEQKQFKLTISKATSSVSLSTVQNGKSVTLTATVTPNAATGKVTFDVNGKTREATISNGKASITISDLSPASYPAKATYGGDSNYKTSTASTTINVDKVYSITNVGDTEGTYLNTKVSATFLDANGKALANTKVTFKAGGKSFSTTTDSNGVATADVDLKVGNYNVTALNPATKEEKQFKLSISLAGAKIISQNLNTEYASGTFTFKLVDAATNKPLTGKKLSYSIYNAGGSVTTDKNGIATIDNSNLQMIKSENYVLTFKKNLDVGKHPITIKGDDSSITVAEFKDYITVGQATINIKIDSYNEYFQSCKKLGITVTNAKTGVPMKGVVLHLYMPNTANKDYYVQTGDDGIAEIDVSGLNPSVYSLSVVNNDTKNIVEKKVSGTITILDPASKTTPILSAKSVQYVYGNTKQYVVTLTQSDGTPIANEEIEVIGLGLYTDSSFSSGGAFTTDDNGQAKLKLSGFTPDTYDVYINAKGCKELHTTIVIKKATPKLTVASKTFKASTKTKKYTITLKNSKNKALKKVKVTLKVNGKTYTAKTNSYGKATFKITKLTKKGKFTATVKYAGNKYYKAKSVSAKITVK